MKQANFKIPIYNWDFTVICLGSPADAPKLSAIATKYAFPDKETLIEHVQKKSYDGGKTYTKKSTRQIIVIIFPQSSKQKLFNTLNHEKRHVIDDILEWHDVHDKEAAAYLDGFLSEELYKHLKQSKVI